MGWLKRLKYWIFPPRASTQTWMFLTFALFVGLAVVAVGFYLAFFLREEVDQAIRDTLHEQIERIAVQVEQAERPEEGLASLQRIARHADLHITVASEDSVYWSVQEGQVVEGDALLSEPAIDNLEPGVVWYATQDGSADSRLLVAALKSERSGLIIHIAQNEPPLFNMVRRMQIVLGVGMLTALIMALLGSWIAAYQVTTPLKAIRDSARNISEGDFDKKIRVDTRSAEIQDLAQNLNTMSASFRNQIDELERLAQLQSEFIGNVSHEVRNPIFAVSGYLEALATSSLSEDQRKRYAEKGLTNLQRLNSLFNDLIDIAQLEYREDLIQAKVFDLKKVVSDVGELLHPKAEDKDLTLEVENPSLHVEADPDRIRQVLTNLIENAIAYTEEGSVRCRYRRHAEKVRIEVVDTGKGIPEDHLERIFERFYRVNPDRARKSGGTGLGLSIVKQILQAHGEKIHAESTAGRGTRFWFELPYAGQKVEQEAVEA